MNLNNVRIGEMQEVFDALEEAFNATGTDYYLIGALARELWFGEGKKISRQTKDVDFAVLVGSNNEYQAVRQYLIEHKKFNAIKGNDFVMFTPTAIQVDILPFGEVEIDDGVSLLVMVFKILKLMDLWKYIGLAPRR